MKENNQNEAPRNVLTDQLFRIQEQQNQILRGFRFKFPPQQLSSSHINTESNVRLSKNKEQAFSTTCHSKTHQPPSASYKIDNKASIVNGKLVLFQADSKTLKQNGRQLMKLLKENHIDFKDFMLGDQEKYLRLIEERQKKKQEALINQYIDKHIKMQKTTKIEVANHGYSLKATASTLNFTQ